MALKTKVGNTTSGKGTTSLRCSVPEGIASYLNVHAGEYLFWHMMSYNGKEVAIVTKEEKIDNDNTN